MTTAPVSLAAQKARRDQSIRREPQPFSIVKQEQTPMTTDTDQPIETAIETPATAPADATARLAELQAQQRKLAEEARTLKASLPKIDPLQRVLQQQAEHPADPLLLGKVKGRIAAGQDRQQAIDAVLTATKAWLEANVPTPSND